MLNRGDRSSGLCLRVKAFHLSLVSTMLAVDFFINGLYQSQLTFASVFEYFYHERVLNFIISSTKIIMYFVLYFLNMVYNIN